MSTESAIIFFITILIFSVTPGPGVFAILAKSLSEGVKPCLSLSFGMAASDIVYLVLACYGLAALAQEWEVAFTVVRIVGAFYLFYLGWKIWHSRAAYIDNSQTPTVRSHFAGFAQGFLISASNPKVILFYITFLPSFMDLTKLGRNDILLAAAITFVGLTIGLVSIALGASWAKRLFRSQKSLTGINRLSGSIMMSAGIYLGLR